MTRQGEIQPSALTLAERVEVDTLFRHAQGGNHYAVLGVTKDTSRGEMINAHVGLKRRLTELAEKEHPGAFPYTQITAVRDAAEIAVDLLSDPLRRFQYDQQLAEEAARAKSAPPVAPEDTRRLHAQEVFTSRATPLNTPKVPTPSHGTPRAPTPVTGTPRAPTPVLGTPRAPTPVLGTPKAPTPVTGVPAATAEGRARTVSSTGVPVPPVRTPLSDRPPQRSSAPDTARVTPVPPPVPPRGTQPAVIPPPLIRTHAPESTLRTPTSPRNSDPAVAVPARSNPPPRNSDPAMAAVSRPAPPSPAPAPAETPPPAPAPRREEVPSLDFGPPDDVAELRVRVERLERALVGLTDAVEACLAPTGDQDAERLVALAALAKLRGENALILAPRAEAEGRWDSAAKHWQHACAAFPGRVEYYLSGARAMFRAGGDPATIQGILLRALDADPSNTEALSLLAVVTQG